MPIHSEPKVLQPQSNSFGTQGWSEGAAAVRCELQWGSLVNTVAESLLASSKQSKMVPIIATGNLDGIDFEILPKNQDSDHSPVCLGRFGHGKFWCLVDGKAFAAQRPVDVCNLFPKRLLASDNLINRTELVRYGAGQRLGKLASLVGERMLGSRKSAEPTGPEGEAAVQAEVADSPLQVCRQEMWC